MAARKKRTKKTRDVTYKVTLRPLSSKKTAALEVVYVTGANVEFSTGAVEGEYTHVEIRNEEGLTVYVVPAYRLVSIEDISSVKSESENTSVGASCPETASPGNVIKLHQ